MSITAATYRGASGTDFSRSKKATAPAGMIEVEVTGLPQFPSSPGTANVRIEFEKGLVLDRRDMEVGRLIEFLDRIKPVLCLRVRYSEESTAENSAPP